MQLKRSLPFKRPTLAGASFSSFLIVLLLVLQTLGVSEQLHHELHADSSDSGHQCAVTLHAHSPLTIVDSAVAVPLPALVTIGSIDLGSRAVSTVEYLLSPGRGPPSLLS